MADFIDINDIEFRYSGGGSNNNANFSLGGTRSVFVIGNGINNLFDNVNESQSEDGHVDFRCFYLINTSITNTLFSTTAWITNVTGGSTVEFGIRVPATDLQQITVTGTTTGGSFILTHEGTNTTAIAWDTDAAVWAQNIEDGLNGISYLEGVNVIAAPSGGNTIFNVSFGGRYDQRSHDLLVVNSNDIIPATSVSITKFTEGSPINTTAPAIATETTPPTLVGFSSPTEASPLTIGTIRPSDLVPCWIKRTTLAGVDPKPSDGFGFRIVGEPF